MSGEKRERYERMTLVIAHGITLLAVVGLLLFQVWEREASMNRGEDRLEVITKEIDSLVDHSQEIADADRRRMDEQTDRLLSEFEQLLEEHTE